jgi:2'-5' RNA ligase
MRFMQSKVVVLPLDPNGAVRALHERIADRIRAAKIVNERARFTFTPHCTLNLYRELPPEELRNVLAARFDEPVLVDAIQAYRATSTSSSKRLFTLPLAARAPS